jgi:uncharacterized membrane protein YedE/YeeE
MEIVHFTPWSALAGGALIGSAVSLFLLGTGRIAGISGVLGGLLEPKPGDLAWRLVFLAGLLVSGAVAAVWFGDRLAFGITRPGWAMVAAGLLVGFGTRLGNGCTSGHGVCGLSRLSVRSLAATLTFMATGALTVWASGKLFVEAP